MEDYNNYETQKRYRKFYEEYHNVKLPENGIVVLTNERGSVRHLRYISDEAEIYLWKIMHSKE